MIKEVAVEGPNFTGIAKKAEFAVNTSFVVDLFHNI
jgi:hypothetical protein